MQDAPNPTNEQFIGTIDLWTLGTVRWPILRAFCRGYVEQRELRQYERQLLATRRWSMVRCVPLVDQAADTVPHIFDIYGVVASAP
jgi:hypothetical protein